MDGLTISSGKNVLSTGRTTSQLRELNMKDQDLNLGQGPSFAATLSQAVDKVNDLQQTADVKAQKLATGESKSIPEVMVAMEKADIALKLMVSVRNKVIDAYQEIMKMQV
jgi:flagellar hook-basal body complex protein FliE